MPDTELDNLDITINNPNNDDCTRKKGGKWPSIPPYNGGPFPTRTWTRYVPPCPNYENFTKEQLDMRRKAEVLQYKNVKSNRTKKERYAYLAKSNNAVVFGTPNHTNKNCVKSTRDSNVPGPAMNLFIDESVPVFGLRNLRSYGNSGNKSGKVNKLPALSVLQFT